MMALGRPRTLSAHSLLRLLCVLLGCLCLQASAYFVITEPTKATTWSNGQANVVRWDKGLMDSISSFDVELSRMSMDGLTLVARNVPTTKNFAFNLLLQDVPPGEDYILMFINATHGVMHAMSPKFSILDASQLPSSDQTASEADPSAVTVTVSGAPHPTKPFATTFPAVKGGAVSMVRFVGPGGVMVMTVLCVGLGVAGGAVWTLV